MKTSLTTDYKKRQTILPPQRRRAHGGLTENVLPYLAQLEEDEAGPDAAEIIFLCSPNNPTGNALSEENVRAVVEGTESIVFLEEFEKANTTS